MSGGIFVSYRRDDAKHAAGRLIDRLGRTFPSDQLFLDIDSIDPGVDFKQVISQKIQNCDVLLAVIGPAWLSSCDKSGHRRLEDPNDFVRLEIEAALARDVRVIPVLVDGANMPAEADLPSTLCGLASRNAVRLTHERFASDAEDLTKALTKIVTPIGAPSPIDVGWGHFRIYEKFNSDCDLERLLEMVNHLKLIGRGHWIRALTKDRFEGTINIRDVTTFRIHGSLRETAPGHMLLDVDGRIEYGRKLLTFISVAVLSVVIIVVSAKYFDAAAIGVPIALLVSVSFLWNIILSLVRGRHYAALAADFTKVLFEQGRIL